MIAGRDWFSVLVPQGFGAREILDLFWIFLGVSAVVWVLVVICLFAAVRGSREPAIREPLAEDPRFERRTRVIVSSLVLVTGIILVVLTGFSFFTGRSLASLRGQETATIRVIGHRWWWEVRYEGEPASLGFTTANEIHLPVGKPVKVKLESDDVIHSFWVPNLSGKEDLIPGAQNELYLKAETAGTYRGQCAEFCGLQHAHMALLVIAEPEEEFERWRITQRAAAASPSSDEARRGEQVFQSKGCLMCHTVRGTSAGGRVAPDLTHFASQHTIAAGTLPFTRGALAAWIADPQTVKPGSNMPRVDLDPDELNAVVAYVEGLK